MIQNFYKLIFLLLCVCSTSNTLWGEGIGNSTKNYLVTCSSEKTYIHTDRNIYIAGENLFFKVYVINKASFKLSDQSKIAYLVLRNQKNEAISDVRLRVENGIAFGNVFLPDTLSSGYYQILAYTNCMRNESEMLYFAKEIFIANQFDKEIFKLNNQVSIDDKEVNTQLADSLLKVYQRDTVLNDVQSLSIIPDKREYEKREKISLHIAMPQGFEKTSANVSVSVFEEMPAEFDDLSLVNLYVDDNAITMKRALLYSNFKKNQSLKEFKIQGYVINTRNDSGYFNCGINLSTIDNSLPELNTVTNRNGQFSFPLNRAYEGKNLSFKITGVNSNILENLSISVFKENDSPIKSLSFKYLLEYKEQIIQGSVYSLRNKKAIPNCCVLLSAPDSVANLLYTYTDSLGLFRFQLNNYYDGKDIVIRLKDDLSIQKPKIEIADKFELLNEFIPEKINLNANFVNYIFKSQSIAQIRKSYGIQVLSDEYPIRNQGSRPVLYSKSETKVIPSDYVKLNDFTEIAKEILPTVKVRKHEENLEVDLLNSANSQYFKATPAIFIDGVYSNDINRIATFGTEKIKKIETINKSWYYGSLNFNGILSIVTDNQEVKNFKSSVNFIYPTGTYHESAKYAVLAHMNKTDMLNIPDFRQLLYWNPSITLNDKQPANFEFFASDLVRTYIIRVEGITSEGKPISAVSKIQVKK